MMAFHTTSPANAAVTAFMRWPAMTTVMAASITFAGYLPPETGELISQACSQFANPACELVAKNAPQGVAFTPAHAAADGATRAPR